MHGEQKRKKKIKNKREYGNYNTKPKRIKKTLR